jgi:hypothetical protein
MPTIDLKDVCKIVQQDLIDVAKTNAPLLKPEQTGTLDAIVSPINKAGTRQLQTDLRDGKYHQVKLEYITPTTHDEVTDTEGGLCTPGNTVAPKHALVKVTRYREIKRDFDEEEMRHFLKAPSAYRAQVMASDMNAITRAINRDLVALTLANVGPFIEGGASGKDINLIRNKNGEIRADVSGETTVMEDMQDLAVSGMPMVIGAGNVSRYATLQKLGTANDIGQDISKLKNWMFFRDRDPDLINPLAPGKSNMIVFAPGACQLITFNKYKGEFAHASPLVQKRTIVNPVKGLEFDWNFKYDDCAERYISTTMLHYDYWVLPSDAFKATDERNGVNYTFHYAANDVADV